MRAEPSEKAGARRGMRGLITKRLFDMVFATLGLVSLAPLFLLVAACIKLDSQGPVFFRQERVGRFGKLFRIHKFRTMRLGAEKAGPLVTRAGDERITLVGRFLRRHKIDELPQLIDVLNGKMSLVGARPEVPRYIEHYPPQAKALILALRPGITDPASILYSREEELLANSLDPEGDYIKKVLPEKLRYYEEYVQRRSLWRDVVLILRTLKAIVVS